MAMPKWHQIMRPVLETLEQGDVVTSKELLAAMVDEFGLTDEEQAERLKSGQLRIYNRMYWAITDLEKAKLLSYGDKRGTYRITDDGRVFLASHASPITTDVLMADCPSFREWKEGYQAQERAKKTGAQDSPEVGDVDDAASPEEVMQQADGELRDALADDLLHAIMGKDPYFFEHLVARLLEAMGYGESLEEPSTVTPKTGDEGIDGIVKEDRLGFDSVYYQAKRYDFGNSVQRPELQKFVGALSGKGASKGLFITTADFTRGARDYAEGLTSQRIVLVNGRALAGLMIDYGVGVSVKATYRVCSVDLDFFEEG
ncbi:MAG: restriction endonuclease [Atopobiaceae bacterium]|jgi:restriction system protein|nr:restriction endonuclease [Atopobiaceae bacterium]